MPLTTRSWSWVDCARLYDATVERRDAVSHALQLEQADRLHNVDPRPTTVKKDQKDSLTVRACPIRHAVGEKER